eukprot:TRINITY_DN23273_c0_g1_i4.p1 TRINITY_DN23273_c0_g1~~TRINITY_DN23273_c0_g1_i4.p1  ORF type:complete len:439 (+),score=114.20 TRINITY_DN23273_c0_g1_i4:69-1385(+)
MCIRDRVSTQSTWGILENASKQIYTRRMKTQIASIAVVLLLLAVSCEASLFRTSNGKITRDGQPIHIRGVTWRGIDNMKQGAPYGLYYHSLFQLMAKLREMGFNAVKIPLCPHEIKDQRPKNTSVEWSLNEELINNGVKDSTLDIIDKIMELAKTNQIYVVFTISHLRCYEGPDPISDLWYDPKGLSEKEIIDFWKEFANKYRTNDFFLGISPKNGVGKRATWGTGGSTPSVRGIDEPVDWKVGFEKVAEEIFNVNENILVFLEGLGEQTKDTECELDIKGLDHGENLYPVSCRPLSEDVTKHNTIVYHPQVVGPDLSKGREYIKTDENLSKQPDIWEKLIGWMPKKGYTVALSEWGGVCGKGSKDHLWQVQFTKWLAEKKICDSFYYALEPNSPAGGIFLPDWVTVSATKLEVIHNYWKACGWTPTPLPAQYIHLMI